MARYVLSFISILAAGWILMMASGWDPVYEYTVQIINWFPVNPFKSIILAAGFLLSAYYLLGKPMSKDVQILITRTESGEIRLAKEAVDDIIQRSVSGISGLKRLSTSLKQVQSGIEIMLSCQLEEGYDISQLAAKIQAKIRHDVQQYSGIEVKEVKVLVRPLSRLHAALRK